MPDIFFLQPASTGSDLQPTATEGNAGVAGGPTGPGVPIGSSSSSSSDLAGSISSISSIGTATATSTSPEPTESVIQFYPPNATYGPDQVKFVWNKMDTVTIHELLWIVNPGTNNTISASTSGKTDGNFTSVELNSYAVLNIASSFALEHMNMPMALHLNWETDDGSAVGYSDTAEFLVQGPPNEPASISIVSSFGSQPTQHSTVGPGIPSSTATLSGSIQTASATSSSTPDHHGGGGLSTGAIAGIAVACALVGLAAIFALIWFFFFRRRRTRHGVSGRGPENHSLNSSFGDHANAGFATDKIVPARIGTPQSHRSRRGYEGGDFSPVDQDPIRSHSEAMQRHSGFHDEEVPAMTTEHHSGTGTPVVSRSVAHLIEEGMTPEEIRQLEEEERHLDAEIERSRNH